MYCFLHKEGEKIVPCFEKMEGFNPAESLEVLFKSLIRGDNADYKLISTADLDTSVDVSLLGEKDCIKKDSFPFEIQSAFPERRQSGQILFFISQKKRELMMLINQENSMLLKLNVWQVKHPPSLSILDWMHGASLFHRSILR